MNVFCSEIDAESKNVIGMIPLYTIHDILSQMWIIAFSPSFGEHIVGLMIPALPPKREGPNSDIHICLNILLRVCGFTTDFSQLGSREIASIDILLILRTLDLF